MGLAESRPYGLLVVEVFNGKIILNVLCHRMASPNILLSLLKKPKRWPGGPSGLAGVPASCCPSTFGPDRSRFGKPEASLQKMPPEPGADSLVATLYQDFWFLLLLCFLRSEAAENRNRLVMVKMPASFLERLGCRAEP